MTELQRAAQAVLEDFDTYGEILQTDESLEYGPDSAIEQLRSALIHEIGSDACFGE
jgi:hypothetical protein